MSPINAFATVSTVTLTPAQTRALFGDSISYTYFDGQDYVTGTANYLNTGVYSGTGNIAHYDDLPLSGSWIVYQSEEYQWNSSGNDYFSVQLSPSVSLFGLNSFQMGVGCTIASQYVNGVLDHAVSWPFNQYPLNYVEYSVSGDPVRKDCAWYHMSPTVSSPYISYAEFLLGNSQTPVCFRLAPIDFTSDVFSSISDICFTAQNMVHKNIGTNGPSGKTYFIVQCPTLSSTYVVGDGEPTGTDLTSTNQKLDTIISILSMMVQNGNYSGQMSQEELVAAISEQQSENLSENGPLAWLKEKFHNLTDRVGSIVSGFTSSLTNLFTPSESAVTSFKDSIDGTLHDTFGSVYDSGNLHQTLSSSIQNQLEYGSGMDAVMIQPVTVNLAGTNFTFPPVDQPGQQYTVSLRPHYQELCLLYDALATIVDICAVILVLNMLKNKWESILTNREVKD